MKYSSKLYRFMLGRYGIDSLYRFLIYVCFFLTFINLFLSSKIIEIVEIFLFIFSLYRVFSKNISRRKKEEDVYLKFKNFIVHLFHNRNHVYYIYRRCRYCKTKLRLPLPSKRGFQRVRCPKCGMRIRIFTLKKENVEVIRKRR